MSIPLKVVKPTGFQQYDCTGCGDCCRGRFAIIISPADRERILAQEWSREELNLGSQALFVPQGDGFQLAHRKDGACVFLGDDNLCRIHARFGEAAKPLACRLYPFTFVPLGGGQVRVDVRFDCPATASNLGRPIAVHQPALQQLVRDAVPQDAAMLPPPPLYDDVHLAWEQLARVTQAFEQVLLDVSLDITRRVAACIRMANALRHPDIGTLKGGKLGDLLDALASEVQEAAADDALEREAPPGPARLAFRQLLGLYGRYDTVGARAHFGRRLRVSLGMMAGRGAVPAIRDGFPRVSFAAIEGARGVPTGTAAGALERYLHVHLSSMGFFGASFYGRSYLDGLNMLLLTYPLVCWYARAFAVHDGLPQPDAACVERALMIVDHQHGVTPLLNIPTERARTRMLCEESVLRALVVWYGS